MKCSVLRCVVDVATAKMNSRAQHARKTQRRQLCVRTDVISFCLRCAQCAHYSIRSISECEMAKAKYEMKNDNTVVIHAASNFIICVFICQDTFKLIAI